MATPMLVGCVGVVHAGAGVSRAVCSVACMAKSVPVGWGGGLVLLWMH